MDFWSIVSILALGLVAGVIARMLVPNDAFHTMSGWRSWLVSIVIGLLGALLGYWFFGLLGIGDDEAFDWGGLIGAVIFAVILTAIFSAVMRRRGVGSGTPR
jgi:uncharacterized membrane protein YeaQ/YmgE (transglycosylase-associated protein family)